MAPLTTAKRKRLRRTSFALPKERKYPIDTKNRARSALARVSTFGTAAEKAKVRRAVYRKYPEFKK